jgi:hypothetical protein
MKWATASGAHGTGFNALRVHHASSAWGTRRWPSNTGVCPPTLRLSFSLSDSAFAPFFSLPLLPTLLLFYRPVCFATHAEKIYSPTLRLLLGRLLTQHGPRSLPRPIALRTTAPAHAPRPLPTFCSLTNYRILPHSRCHGYFYAPALCRPRRTASARAVQLQEPAER